MQNIYESGIYTIWFYFGETGPEFEIKKSKTEDSELMIYRVRIAESSNHHLEQAVIGAFGHFEWNLFDSESIKIFSELPKDLSNFISISKIWHKLDTLSKDLISEYKETKNCSGIKSKETEEKINRHSNVKRRIIEHLNAKNVKHEISYDIKFEDEEITWIIKPEDKVVLRITWSADGRFHKGYLAGGYISLYETAQPAGSKVTDKEAKDLNNSINALNAICVLLNSYNEVFNAEEANSIVLAAMSLYTSYPLATL